MLRTNFARRLVTMEKIVEPASDIKVCVRALKLSRALSFLVKQAAVPADASWKRIGKRKEEAVSPNHVEPPIEKTPVLDSSTEDTQMGDQLNPT